MGTWMVHVSIFLVTAVIVTDGAKILVSPSTWPSHINIYTKLARALKDDGHEVWVLAADRFVEMIEKRGLIPLTYPLRPEEDVFGKMGEWFEERPDGETVWEQYISSEYWMMSISRICDSVFQSDQMMSTIRREKFDLAVIDNVCYNLCMLMIPYIFDIPFVSVFSFQTSPWIPGVTGLPSIEPEIFQPSSNKMNFWERIDNLKTWLEFYNDVYSDLYSDHHMKNYCPAHKPKITFNELKKKAEMHFLNFEVMCLDYPRVSAPNMQYLGGSTVSPVQPLPEELEAFVAGAEHGVVVMTFGSWLPVHQLWRIIGEKLFKAFGRLPQKVIVQYRLDKIHGKVPPNVKLVKWMPQNDLLGHPKTKLFVMHGGNNGQNEAVYHGVPMIVIPAMYDQIYTGLRIEVHGYGKYVRDKKAITSDELYEMMTDIINNGSYTTNIKKCSAILHSMPSAQEKFVFWVNHVLKFGGAHLRPPSLDMPLYQVLMLDIVAYYVIIGLVSLHAGIFALYYIIKLLLKHHKQKNE